LLFWGIFVYTSADRKGKLQTITYPCLLVAEWMSLLEQLDE